MHNNDTTLYPAWGTVTPSFWAGDASAPPRTSAPEQAAQSRQQTAGAPPAAHFDAISAVNTAIGEGRLADAAALARDLEQLITTEYGEQHDYCAQIREIRAHIAHLAGDHAEATATYLGVTGIRAHTLGLHHPLTQASAHRTAATWQSINDVAKTLEFADTVLAMLADVTGPNSRVTQGAHAHLARRTS